MPDQLTQLTFEHKLTTRVAAARIPRRRGAGQQARAALIAAIAADHETALAAHTARHGKERDDDDRLIVALRKSVTNLRRELAGLGHVRDGLRGDLDTARRERDDYAARLRVTDASCANVAAERDETREHADSLATDLDDAGATIEDLRGELRQATAALSRVRSTWTPPQDEAPKGHMPAPAPPPAAPATPGSARDGAGRFTGKPRDGAEAPAHTGVTPKAPAGRTEPPGAAK